MVDKDDIIAELRVIVDAQTKRIAESSKPPVIRSPATIIEEP